MIGLIGRKAGMTQVFQPDGTMVAVSVLEVAPNTVTRLRTPDRDGYTAVQLGTDEKSKLTRPRAGQLGDLPSLGTLREFRVDDASGYEVGQKLDVSMFEVGSSVDVVGVSKGRGFAGVTKRHHFTGGRETHGCVTHKQPGSIGASAYPSRVIKGKRLPGRMGGERVTVKNLGVIGVDAEQNLIWVRGSVPGHPNSTVLIRQTAKARA